jgi:diguanylate cyclase (GGDEF)-like protein
MIRKLSEFLERRSKRGLAVLAYSIAVVLGLLDFLTAVKVHFLLLYLLPIFLGSWFISRNIGIRLAIFTSLIWFVAHSLSTSYTGGWIAYANLAVRTTVFILFAITQAELRAKLKELSNLASRDLLTGLPNSHAFYRLTAREMDRAFGVEPMTLVCIDVEGFDWVNHRFGHPTGDQMMCTIAHTIRQHVPRPDLVARVGGTSFAILLPGIASEVAGLILETLQEALHAERRRCSHPLTFFISAIACTKAPRTLAELIQEADAQMTRLKGGGKKDSLQIATVDRLHALN